MRLSRFLCANPAYPHPLDLPGRPHGQCLDFPTGLLPLVPDLEAGKPACHTPPDAVVVVFVAQRRRGRCARSWFNAFGVVVLVTQCPHCAQRAQHTRLDVSPAIASLTSHVQGESMIDCSQFSKCCKDKQAFTGLVLQPRGL
jgi:hypothetical protein